MPKKRKKKEVPVLNDYEDGLIKRMTECQQVIDEIDNSALWKIVLKDMEELRRILDATWQEIIDSKKLEESRVLKFSTMHIINLKAKYQEELKDLQEKLYTHQNKATIIPKDYDLETNIEGRESGQD